MKVLQFHRWDLEYGEAVTVQRELAAKVQEGPPLEKVETVAAADVSGERQDEQIVAVVVVMRLGSGGGDTLFPLQGSSDVSAVSLEVLEVRHAVMPAPWPYVPGLLSFREAPVVLEAFRQVKTEPDVVICDGQGRAHPRRLGLASHVGLALNVPTIGCAKSRLIGTVPHEPPRERGGEAPLMHHGERIGTVLRTRTGVEPVFVSVGHKIDLASAVRWVLATAPKYRLPEPSRMAHRLVTQYKSRLASPSGGHSANADPGGADAR